MAIAEKGGIRIPIITYYSDKGVKAASKGLMGLETAASKLGKTLGVTLSAAALVSFGKKSLDVFAKEQKAMTQLTNTLYNLGLAYQGIGVNQFLNDLQDATGVAKDQLAPALQTLTTYTLNYAKAQEILNTALNVAAANQLDVQQVSDALAKAYAGNNKALVGLNIGITAAEAKSESFAQIMAKLNQTFKDAALVDTYKTRLDKLKIAATDAMSYIGQGIAEAMNTLTADGNIQNTMENLRNIGKVISMELIGFAAGIKQLFKDISQIPLVRVILGVAGGVIKGLDKLFGISKAAKADITAFNEKLAKDQAKADAKAQAAAKQQEALNKKLRAQQLAEQKKINAEREKQTKLEALSLKYKQAASIFDMEQIELAAASMAKQSNEDYARIKLKQDLIVLQDAINAGDLKAAEAAAKIVEEDYKRVWAYQAQNIALGYQQGIIQNLQNAAKLIPQDMNLINLGNLKSALDYINSMLLALSNIPTVSNPSTPNSSNKGVFNPPTMADKPDDLSNSDWQKIIDDYTNAFNEDVVVPDVSSTSTWDPSFFRRGDNNNLPTVVVQITDNAQKLVDAVTFATQNTSANGTPIALNRNAINLAW